MQKVTLEALPQIAQDVLVSLDSARDKSRATLITLRGDLGAGKTTFTQVLAKELGVEAVVQSPTYVLMKKYPLTQQTFKTLIHIDAYRLEKPEEFTALKPEEFLNDPSNLVVVEWPERLGNLLPVPHISIAFSADPLAGEAGAASPQERYIEIHHG